ncbi:MAG TPA: HAD-IA family hydrolase [Chloroflexota bacterium]|nr:HAD-IA family hydrolase [Chloroflexota bacterium]
MPRLRVDAVLFDMDGTLIDESASYREAIRKTAELFLSEAVAMDEVDEIKRRPGFNNDVDATWALIGYRTHGHAFQPDTADRASYAYRRIRSVFQTYYLGDRLWREISGTEPPFAWSEPLMARESLLVTHEALARLSTLALGIVTSRPRVEALMALHEHDLDRYFPAEAIVTVDDIEEEKPHPAPVLALIDRLGAREPVLVGDTINDALAALAAGIPFVQIGTEPLSDTEAENHTTRRIESVNDLLELIETLVSA